MQVRQAMSSDVRCCAPETPIPDVARMMVDGDCGAIPVIDDARRPVGLVTDRDITVRTIAKGQDPRAMKAVDCMTQPVTSVRADMPLHDAVRLMERKHVRRIPVIDDRGACCGILALADVARLSPDHDTVTLLKDVSRPDTPAYGV